MTLNSSTPSLKELDFDDKAWSVNIDGNCAWIAYEQVVDTCLNKMLYWAFSNFNATFFSLDIKGKV